MTEQELRSVDHSIATLIGDVWTPDPNDPTTGWWVGRDGAKISCADGGPFRYSTDIGAAWRVVERLTEGEYVKVICSVSHYHGDWCRVIAADPSQRHPDDLVVCDALVNAETMPLAICSAALKAVSGV